MTERNQRDDDDGERELSDEEFRELMEQGLERELGPLFDALTEPQS